MAKRWIIEPGEIAGGRLTVFKPPDPETPCALGLDFAQGIEGGDYDAGVMFDVFGNQVLTLHGRWGVSDFPEILWPVVEAYQPFIVGERQVGLPVLRWLWDKGAWMYFNRKEESRAKRQVDILGHHAYRGDGIIPRLQRAIRNRTGGSSITVRDAELLGELTKFTYRPRAKSMTFEEARDTDLTWGAPSGEHDDLVMAAAYAVAGLVWLEHFPKPKPRFAPGTLGDRLGHEQVLNPPNQQARSRLRRGALPEA